MLQTLRLKLGSAAEHPVGVSLLHRPIPEHAQHQPGQTHSTTTSRTVAQGAARPPAATGRPTSRTVAQGGAKPPSLRGRFPGRKR